jgi:hypothetical protein
VQPCGQLYWGGAGAAPDIRPHGLGVLAALTDDALLRLLYLLPAADLQRVGMASRALYAFAHFDELWKALALEVRCLRLLLLRRRLLCRWLLAVERAALHTF